MKLFEFFKKDRRTQKRRTGDIGEDLAVEYLKKEGYLILARNWTHGKNEIDIIIYDKRSTVAFVEVKTTASDSARDFKAPSQAVDKRKMANLIECAKAYLPVRKRALRLPYSDWYRSENYRFDIIEVYLNRDTPEINHIQDAFIAQKGYKKWKT